MPTMSNLSSDMRDSVSKPTPSLTELATMEVMITFNDGSRFQFQIQVPQSFWSCAKDDGGTLAEWTNWFSEQKFLAGYEFSRTGHTPDLCVSPQVTIINMANVSQIRGLQR